MIAFEQGTLYAVSGTAGAALLLVREGRVIASTESLNWTRGQPWEQIERRLRLLSYQVRKLSGEDGKGAPAAESVPG